MQSNNINKVLIPIIFLLIGIGLGVLLKEPVTAALKSAGGPKYCTYEGIKYKSGEPMPSIDNCNSCSCDNGEIACTAMACEEPVLNQ